MKLRFECYPFSAFSFFRSYAGSVAEEVEDPEEAVSDQEELNLSEHIDFLQVRKTVCVL